MSKIGYIYAIENNFDNNVYVGRTIKTIKDRFTQHKHSALTRPNCLLHKFMALHGPENFTVRKLRKVKYNSIIELDLIEEECIRDYGSLNTVYNNKCYEMGNISLKEIVKERKPRVNTTFKQLILPSSEEIIKIAFENTLNNKLLSIQSFLNLFLNEEDMVIKIINEKVVNNKIYVEAMLFEWLGYDGIENKKKQTFIKLLENNNIEYQEIDYKDPLIKYFIEIQEEIETMRKVDLPRKRWLIMEPKDFKEAIMCLTTKRSKEIRKYYLLLEELIQLYGTYTTQFESK
ncbi:hypothetical protein IIV30_003L [Invertebrate iridescent virus 30]|uniref:GIY-YIG domain-containing protein n=1 Tax=Invertebrate iridescent virus 30 TaxID=345585 RepID=W8W1N6_9VIRU|nr:hypothetical protein IIV30_003L [Invertebrate iridescent virus 30]CCV02198.1 hypothetical protein IIV30_003L [Invertebrate iridescent virus 30]